MPGSRWREARPRENPKCLASCCRANKIIELPHTHRRSCCMDACSCLKCAYRTATCTRSQWPLSAPLDSERLHRALQGLPGYRFTHALRGHTTVSQVYRRIGPFRASPPIPIGPEIQGAPHPFPKAPRRRQPQAPRYALAHHSQNAARLLSVLIAARLPRAAHLA